MYHQNIIHGDLHANNILRFSNPGAKSEADKYMAKLVDFGHSIWYGHFGRGYLYFSSTDQIKCDGKSNDMKLLYSHLWQLHDELVNNNIPIEYDHGAYIEMLDKLSCSPNMDELITKYLSDQ